MEKENAQEFEELASEKIDEANPLTKATIPSTRGDSSDDAVVEVTPDVEEESLSAEQLIEKREGVDIVSPERSLNIRRKKWEAGKADYMGVDNFENIWIRLKTLIDPSGTTDWISSSPPLSDPESSLLAGEGCSEKLPGYKVGDYKAMRHFEQGKIDYGGKDNSDTIMRRLDFLIQNGMSPPDEEV